MPWATLMATYMLMAAMTSPILTAVPASRQTDIEHSGVDWTLASTAGYSPGVRAAQSSPLLSRVGTHRYRAEPACRRDGCGRGHPGVVRGGTVDRLQRAAVPRRSGLPGTSHLTRLHCGNQLVSVGVGMLGAFIGVFCPLMPGIVSRFIPWGYYAMISYAGREGAHI